MSCASSSAEEESSAAASTSVWCAASMFLESDPAALDRSSTVAVRLSAIAPLLSAMPEKVSVSWESCVLSVSS